MVFLQDREITELNDTISSYNQEKDGSCVVKLMDIAVKSANLTPTDIQSLE